MNPEHRYDTRNSFQLFFYTNIDFSKHFSPISTSCPIFLQITLKNFGKGQENIKRNFFHPSILPKKGTKKIALISMI